MGDPRLYMQDAAKAVIAQLPSNCGFFLLAFDFGDSNIPSQYVSNAERDDVIKAMHEFIDRQIMQKQENN